MEGIVEDDKIRVCQDYQIGVIAGKGRSRGKSRASRGADTDAIFVTSATQLLPYGINTVSITWMIPFVVSTFAFNTRA